MKKYILFIFSFFTFFLNFGQEVSVNQADSHKSYVERLKNSKDLLYKDILEKYDNYIQKNPKDVLTQVYRCKFIGSAYYDEYEDYDTNYEETENCLNELYIAYPQHPEVILYKLDYLYGEEKVALLDEKIKQYELREIEWNYKQISRLFEMAATAYQESDDSKAVRYAEKAEKFSDSLDLSILITKGYLNLGYEEIAKERLMFSLFRDNSAWELTKKGELLLKFGEDEEALKMFERVKLKDSMYSNADNLYKISIKNQDFEKARSYIVKDTLIEWNKSSGIQKLLKHDIEYSDPKTALRSYRRMQEDSFYDDFFGVKRLQIFF